MLAQFLMISSLPGKALRTLVESRFKNIKSKSKTLPHTQKQLQLLHKENWNTLKDDIINETQVMQMNFERS